MLGAGNTLSNAGTVSPGGLGNVFTSTVTGNFTQSATGTYAVDLDFLPDTADRLNVTGRSTAAGTVALNFLNQGSMLPGEHQHTILSSDGGLASTLTLSAAPSAVATYSLLYPNANDAVLDYNVNFQPAGLPQNLQSLGTAINQILTSRNYPGFAPVAAALFNLPNNASLIQAYNTIGGGGTATTQTVNFGAGQEFMSALLDQASLWLAGGGNDANAMSFVDEDEQALPYAHKKKWRGTDAFAQLQPVQPVQPDRWRVWTMGFGGKQIVDGNAAAALPGQSLTTYGGAFGVDKQINRDLLLGFAVGGSGGTFSVTDRATTGSFDGAHLGVYGMLRRGAWYVSAGLGYGHFDNRTSRMISGVGPSEIATGRFGSDELAGRLEIGRREQFDRFAVTPFTSIEFARLWQQGYSETSTLVGGGAGILGLTYASQTTLSLPTQVGVQLDSQFALANGMVLAPFTRFAWMHEFSQDRQITASFNVAPGVDFTSVGTPAASDLARVIAGAKLMVTQRAWLFASFNGEFAGNTQSYGASGGFKVGW
jgi:outer membrane autotransporter protein